MRLRRARDALCCSCTASLLNLLLHKVLHKVCICVLDFILSGFYELYSMI